MTRAEEVVRSTTRAIASTVRDVPALRLEQAPDELRSAGHGRPRRRPQRHSAGGWPGRWRPGFAPVAAAVAVVVFAVALVIVKNVPNATTTPGVTQKNAAVVKGVPEYYVAWMQARRPYLVVGNTATGARVATVMSPSGVSLNDVYGTADDDRTFIVTGSPTRGVSVRPLWYLLRITPGSQTPARLTPLPIPVLRAPAGVALSPDAAMLAVAQTGTPAVLRIYSTATGALLRSWSARTGQITAAKVQPGSRQFTTTVLRWSPDGRTLAFAWNATTIRTLQATAPNGNLLTRSGTLAGLGTGYTPDGISVTCNAAQGWDVVDAAQGWGVVCAETWQAANSSPNPSGPEKCPAGHQVTRVTTFGFNLQTPYGDGGTEMRPLASEAECSGQVRAGDGAYIGWTNADGTILIGSLVWNGHSRFGVFRGARFTPLPTLPISMPAPTGALLGTDAW